MDKLESVMKSHLVPVHLNRLRRVLMFCGLLAGIFVVVVSVYTSQRVYRLGSDLVQSETKNSMINVKLWIQAQLSPFASIAHTDPLKVNLTSNQLISQKHVFSLENDIGLKSVSGIPWNTQWNKFQQAGVWHVGSSWLVPDSSMYWTPLVYRASDDYQSQRIVLFLNSQELENKVKGLFHKPDVRFHLFSDNGQLLMASEQYTKRIGQSFLHDPVFSAAWEPNSGFLDNDSRYTYSSAISGWPLVLSVSVETADMLKKVEREVTFLAITLLVVILLLLWSGYRLDGMVRRSIRIHDDLLEAQVRLDYLASVDELTGIFNRREFIRQLSDECIRAREGAESSLLMLDLDHFKQVNDRYGHPSGDTVLKNFVRRVRHQIRPTDLIGRYGGEEFLVLLKDISEETSMEIAERLRKSIESTPVLVYGYKPISVTVSIGLIRLDQHCFEVTKALSKVDKALYKAKESGRNQVVQLDLTA